MQTTSGLAFRLRSPKEILLFLLGLFSTMQILQVGGFPLSTWLTVLTAGYLLLTQGFSFRKDWLLLLMLVCTGITFVVSMASNLPAGYKKTSLMGTLQWGLIFIICAYMRRETTARSSSSFFRGFDLSCRIQLIWCILQFVCYKLLNINLNWLVFGQLLHLSNDPNLYLNNIISGLHWHVANLTPILAYLYFRNQKLFTKICCLAIAALSKSATPIVAVGLCVCFDVLRFCKRTLCNRQCSMLHKVAVYIMIGLLGILLISPILLPKVWEVVQYLLLRLYQIQNPTEGNESSAVHFNYYRYLPDILRSIPLQETLVGSGIGTSGWRFTVFLSQFPDAIWTVESDPVNLILSKGILGAFLHYTLLGYTAFKLLRRKQSSYACFIFVLLICGFAYDNQFLWVQLLEFMLYCRVRNRAPFTEKEL